jgi:hypothetical protein
MINYIVRGRAIAEAVSRLLPQRRTGFDPRSGHMRSVAEKAELGQVFSEYFGFPFQVSFHRLLNTHLSSGAGTISQTVADVPSGLSGPKETKKKRTAYEEKATRKATSEFWSNVCASTQR